jgi:hypothetical protein
MLAKFILPYLYSTSLFLGRTRPDMNPGCNERLDWEFTKYVWHFRRDQRPALLESLKNIEGEKLIHRVTSRKQVNDLLDEFSNR